LNTKVLLGTISTRLMSDGSFMISSLHNHCWVQGWKKWISVNFCRSYGQLSWGVVFLWNMV